jgi:Ca-activated chloride channel family protein
MKKIPLSVLFVLCVSAFTALGQSDAKTPMPDAEKRAPISYGIVVDNSGSYRMIMDKVVELVKDIVEENKEGDETFLVSFISTDKIKLQQDFTERKGDIHDAADQMYTEGGLTAIVDALYFSAKYLVKNANSEPGRRKVLVLVTDGEERQSRAKYEELAAFLKDESVSVYAVGVADGKVFTKILDKVTKETGGKVYTPKTGAEIQAAVKSLASDIRKK